MKKKSNDKKIMIFMAIVMAVLVIGVTVFAINKNGEELSSSSANQSANLVDVNSDDYKNFMTYLGEDYDRYFIANMIAHHQGAIEMGNMAIEKAQHQELKDLGNAIVSAQTGEVNSMTSWQTQWGYPVSSGEMMMDHSAMGMMAQMDGMSESLKSLSGDAFDKAFLAQMIIHHQSAINMAAPGKTNALHQEVKDLTAAIISAQTSEIKQMKQWQSDWGYIN